MPKLKDKITWYSEKRKISELHPATYNPRELTEKQAQDLTTSLERFNLADPIVINRDNTIIGGHQRINIIKTKTGNNGFEVDVRIPSRLLTKEEEKELNLRLNKNLGQWDLDALANFNEDFLKDVGFSLEELDNIFELDLDKEDFDVEKALEEAMKGNNLKGVKEGDLWALGTHKLIIGNAVEEKNWKTLFDKESFDFMFTDPPYKITYNSYGKIKKGEGFGYKANRKYLGCEKGKGVPEFDEWLSLANQYQNPSGANIMIFENWKNTPELWASMQKYWKIRNMIIWHVNNRCQGFGMKSQFFNKYDIALLGENGETEINGTEEAELEEYLQRKGQKLLDTYSILLYGIKGKPYWDKQKGTKWARINDVITFNTDTASNSGQGLVFGTKPPQILVGFIKILSPRNGIIMEPFCGSGSTLIASEIMKRRCYAIEFSEIYGEVIINRWEKFTNLKAIKIDNINEKE